MEFYLIGWRHPEVMALDMAGIKGGIGSGPIPRADFVEQLSRMHFVCLPFDGSYYQFAASGTLLDAITHQKPIIAIANDTITDMFRRFGDIGYACKNKAEFGDVLWNLARDPQSVEVRYPDPLEAMERIRKSRAITVLSENYRKCLCLDDN